MLIQINKPVKLLHFDIKCYMCVLNLKMLHLNAEAKSKDEIQIFWWWEEEEPVEALEPVKEQNSPFQQKWSFVHLPS